MLRNLLLTTVMAPSLLGLTLVGVPGSTAFARGGIEVRTAELDPTLRGDPVEDDADGNASAVTYYHRTDPPTTTTAFGILVEGLKGGEEYYLYNPDDSLSNPCTRVVAAFTTDGDGTYYKVIDYGDKDVEDTVDVCRYDGGWILILTGVFEKGGKNTGNKIKIRSVVKRDVTAHSPGGPTICATSGGPAHAGPRRETRRV